MLPGSYFVSSAEPMDAEPPDCPESTFYPDDFGDRLPLSLLEFAEVYEDDRWTGK